MSNSNLKGQRFSDLENVFTHVGTLDPVYLCVILAVLGGISGKLSLFYGWETETQRGCLTNSRSHSA